MHPDNLAAGKEFGLCQAFKVCTGVRYLGGFIGDDKSKREWQRYHTPKREKNICEITKTAKKYPQESYDTLVYTIQLECIFSKRIKKYTWYAFAGVEKIIRETFLPFLLLGKSKYIPPIVVTLSTMAVKKSRLALQYSVPSPNKKYPS